MRLLISGQYRGQVREVRPDEDLRGYIIDVETPSGTRHSYHVVDPDKEVIQRKGVMMIPYGVKVEKLG